MRYFLASFFLALGVAASAMPDRASELMQAGRYAQARAEYERLADYNTPSGVLAASRAADCLFLEGDYSGAAKAYGALPLEMLSPEREAECALNHAISLIQTGRAEQAKPLLEIALNHTATASTARYYMGTVAYDDGDLDRAALLFKNVGSSGPMAVDAQVFLARIEYMRQNWSGAQSEAERLLRLPGLTESQRLELERIEGESLFRLGKRSAAMDRLRPYIRKAPDPELSALYIVGVADYEDGDYPAALKLLEPVADRAEGAMRQSAMLVIGQALLHQGDREGALLAFRTAGTMTDDEATRENALYNYAVAGLQGTVPFGSGIEPFEEYLRSFPNGPHADSVRELLVASFMTANDFDQALVRVQSIRNPSPDVLKAKCRILYNLAARDYRQGDFASARKRIAEASSVRRHDAAAGAEMVLLEAQMLSSEKKNSEAIKKYDQYLREAPRAAVNRPLANYMNGYALLAEDKPVRADKAFADAAGGYAADASVSADILNRRADIQYYSGNFAAAADLYTQAYSKNRAAGDYALYNLARMQGFQRKYADELRSLATFEQEFPASVLMASALMEKAQAQIAAGRSADAIPTLNRVIERYADSPTGRNAYIQKAMTEAETGHIPDAVETYKSLIEKYPTSEAAAQAAPLLKHLLVKQGKPDDYLAFMQSIPDAPAPDATETDDLTYRSALKNNTLEAYLEQFPDGLHAAAALETLADSLYNGGDIPRAVEYWQQLERKAPDPDTATRARMGQMRGARDMGDYPTAGAVAENIINSSASGTALTEARFTRAQAYAEAEQTEQAIELWLQLGADPMSEYGAKSAFFAAEAMNEAGRDEVALKHAKALTTSGTSYHYWVARAYILISDIYKARGKDFQAREYLQALRQNYPGNELDIFDMIDTRLNPSNDE